MGGFLGTPLKNIAINTWIDTIIILSIAKKLKKSYFVEFLSRNAAEAKVPKESDINIKKMQIAFIIGIWLTGNQLTTNLLGEFNIKQKPNPDMYVPIIKNEKW